MCLVHTSLWPFCGCWDLGSVRFILFTTFINNVIFNTHFVQFGLCKSVLPHKHADLVTRLCKVCTRSSKSTRLPHSINCQTNQGIIAHTHEIKLGFNGGYVVVEWPFA